MRPRRRWLAPVALLLISSVATLAAVELIARLIMDRPMTVEVSDHGSEIPSGERSIETTGIPNQGLYVRTATGLRLKRSSRAVVRDHIVSGTDVTITTNSFGFRYPEIGAKLETETRVLVLGDSVTFGGSVQDGETFPDAAERALAESEASSCEGSLIRVINAGVGAVDLQNEFAILMETGLAIEPDVVLVALYLNDAHMSYAIEVSQAPAFIRSSYFLSWISSRLRFLRLRSILETSQDESVEAALETFAAANPPSYAPWLDDAKGFNRLVIESFDDWGFAWSSVYWERVERLLRLMSSVADARQFELAVAFLPVRYQVQAQILRDEPQQRFAELMDRLDLPSLDLLPALRAHYRETGANLFFDHCHYTVAGNEFVGREVAGFLGGLAGCPVVGE